MTPILNSFINTLSTSSTKSFSLVCVICRYAEISNKPIVSMALPPQGSRHLFMVTMRICLITILDQFSTLRRRSFKWTCWPSKTFTSRFNRLWQSRDSPTACLDISTNPFCCLSRVFHILKWVVRRNNSLLNLLAPFPNPSCAQSHQWTHSILECAMMPAPSEHLHNDIFECAVTTPLNSFVNDIFECAATTPLNSFVNDISNRVMTS